MANGVNSVTDQSHEQNYMTVRMAHAKLLHHTFDDVNVLQGSIDVSEDWVSDRGYCGSISRDKQLLAKLLNDQGLVQGHCISGSS